MSSQTRRDFLKTAGIGTLATLAPATVMRAHGANETIRIAVAGINGRGGDHIKAWLPMKDVEIAYLVDPDTRLYAKRLKQVGEKFAAPKTVSDIRTALDDKNVDAISIATPNHWHALMTIWGCQAGKDVYVEKPCSHNVHEGRIAVEAARKHNRIVQHGTQNRSNTNWANLAEVVKSGRYGKLLISRALCYKDGGIGWTTRGDIGRRDPKDPPKELDFNLWLGPAAQQPYHENLVHYRWHWFWDFGNGDIGNQGVHEMDKARWLIPGATRPKSVVSLGGRIGYKDQGQTASSQIAIMDFGETQLIFEVRGLRTKPYSPAKDGADNVLHFEGGVVANNKFYAKGQGEGEPLPKLDPKRGPGGDNFGNFIAAVRSRKVEDLNADISEGNLSCALIHYANASHRLGTPVAFGSGAVKAALNGNTDATDALARLEEHLGKEHNIDLHEWMLTLGRKLTIDSANGSVAGDDEANKLLTRNYRAPFVVPDKI
jgi:predicted dehydrogenase